MLHAKQTTHQPNTTGSVRKNVTLWLFRETTVAAKTAVSIAYAECVSVALLPSMQSVCAVLYCHVWPA